VREELSRLSRKQASCQPDAGTRLASRPGMTKPENFAEALEQLCIVGPYSDIAAAERAFSSVLRVLAGALTTDERLVLAEDLPAGEAQVLREAAELAPSDLPTMVKELASAEHVSAGRAREHLEVVGRALFQMLSRRGQVLVKRALPELAELLTSAEATEGEPSPHELPPVTFHDLAEGRQGGRHPVSSSNPSRLAHRHSVARSDDPHADSKLSSAQGLSQERDGTSLATGRPGSRRPLASDH
jgi:uncharacterized protein (DUF2267 family)